MFELLSYGFFQRAVVSALVMGIVCPLIGVFIILKGISFIGAGTAHAAFAGVSLGFLIGVSPEIPAFAFALVTAWIIGLLDIRGKMKSDVYIGILYTITMALATLFIGLLPGYNTEVYSYLFGSILTVTSRELVEIIAMGLVIVMVLYLFFKEIHFISMDGEMAEAVGVPGKLIYFILLTLVALTVMVGLKSVGSLLVFAMILIPAATAYQLARSMKHLIRLAMAAGVASSMGGLMLSAMFDLPSGATIILVAGAIFFISIAASSAVASLLSHDS